MNVCSTFDLQARICALEAVQAEVTANAGHPPVEVSEGPAFAFDKPTQALVLEDSSDELVSIDTVIFPDQAAMMAVAPANNHQLAILQTDGTNGDLSVWVATGLGVGNWALRLGRMGEQNRDAVSITGGTITSIVPPIPVASGGTGGSTPNVAWTNLTLLEPYITAGDVTYGTINWGESDNYSRVVGSPGTNLPITFVNVIDGKVLYLKLYGGSAGIMTVTWPDGIHWIGGVVPGAPAYGKVDLYIFYAVGDMILGERIPDYPL